MKLFDELGEILSFKMMKKYKIT